MPKTTLMSRLPLALAFAAIIALVHFGLWAYFNQKVQPVDGTHNITGFAFSGFRQDQSPLDKTYPSEDQLADDLNLLGQNSRRIRTYTSSENPAVARLAADRGMRVTAGAWLGGEKESAANEREMNALAESVEENPNIDRVLVGNETLLRGDMSVAQLIEYLDRARWQVKAPVSTAEPWHVWLKNPELADHVDYITVHLLPYHEGVPVNVAVDFALKRYNEIVAAFPRKRVVIGEVGWPSNGPILQQAVPSVENQAHFIREWLSKTKDMNLDYYLMEAFDQPWKTEVEGWAGAYWGMYNADRVAKFPLAGPLNDDVKWMNKAIPATAAAFLPMLLVCLGFRDWKPAGLFTLCVMIQVCVTAVVLGVSLSDNYYLSTRDGAVLVALIVAMVATSAVLLSNGFEFAEVMFKRAWKRRFTPVEPLPAESEPFVSVHLACCNEPPEMVIATIDSLARLNYGNFEVLVVDNNTKDEALWKPVEAHMAKLGERFRFFHLPQWPGFKAGALNFALEQTDPRAEVVGVVDADYVVTPDWLSTLTPHFSAPKVAVVQSPQAHRDWEHNIFRRMCNWEFDGFFHIGMHHRNERNALIQHGTMTLVRRAALAEVGGWSEWCICEDTELGLRLFRAGYEMRYVDHVMGRGLVPSDFAALKSQRFRWAFGAMQILKHHFGALVGRSTLTAGQRYHFLTGWFSWFGDALQFVFAWTSILWTAGMLAAPKVFSLPVTLMLVPIVGFLVIKGALGPILYRRTMNCGWGDILGASVASLGLSHAIARGVFFGLVKKRGHFVRTAKGSKDSKLAIFGPIREECLMLIALTCAAFGMITVRGIDSPETLAWVAMLGLQALPYVSALACQLLAQLPQQRRVADSMEVTKAVLGRIEAKALAQSQAAATRQAIVNKTAVATASK